MSSRICGVDADLATELIEIIVAEHTHVALAAVHLRKLAGSGTPTRAHRATDALVDVIAHKETYDRAQLAKLIAEIRLEIGERVIRDYCAVIEPAIDHVRSSLKTSPETWRRRRELHAPSEAISALIEQGLRGIEKPFCSASWDASAKALVLAIESLDEMHRKIDEFRRSDIETKRYSWAMWVASISLILTLVGLLLAFLLRGP